MMKTKLWEILVPASNNKDVKFTYDHHKEWDAYVRGLTGGVTIMKTAKGEWVSPSGELYVDRMIPCRIICTKEQIYKIIDFTIEHYNQETVVAHKVSTEVILKHRDEVKKPPDPPLTRIIKEGTVGTCPECGSTEIKVRNIPGKRGCINPKCPNYYNKVKKKLL